MKVRILKFIDSWIDDINYYNIFLISDFLRLSGFVFCARNQREREKKLQRNSDDFSGRLVLDSVLCSLNIEICNTEVKIIFMQQRTFNWTTHIK